MTKKLRIAIAQLNLMVGDINGNLRKHIEAAHHARDMLKADLIVFPELGITGYPPEDLLLRKSFIESVSAAVQECIKEITGIHALISYPQQHGNGLLNACALIYNGAVVGRYAKQHLPNYGVFDEDRYFIPGNSPCVVLIDGIQIGLVICEDLWFPGPVQQAAALGARIILSPNASPFESNKHEERLSVLSKRAKTENVAIVYVNNVGGQDELVFDGGSMVINTEGNLSICAGFFNETIALVEMEINSTNTIITSDNAIIPAKLERIYQALVTGLRDYINKNNFPGVLIGVSGGIDSALTLAIAVDALGKDRVHAVLLPSRYTHKISNEDAFEITKALGVKTDLISIEEAHNIFIDLLKPVTQYNKNSITEENIQSRCRGLLLMALSNSTGKLVLPTGNRSEMAVGYCTLYGDMAGGYAVLKDVPKTLVYELATYRNQISRVIPERTINRAPTAELAPDQKDEDSLPPYSVLDAILEAYLNCSMSVDEIISTGFSEEVVKKVVNLVKRNEYKRKQSALGPHINHKSFGKDWRYPNTNGYEE